MDPQQQADVANALSGGAVAETPQGIGMVPPTPGPAATSLDPALQPPAPQQVQQPIPQQIQQPIPQQVQQPIPQQVQQPPVQQVAPNAPGAQPFINPDPNQGINEPVQIDPATGQPVPVIAPANQPGQISPQVEAQEQQRQALEEPPTVDELAAAANTLRATMPDITGAKIAALLDRVAEARIQQDRAQQQQIPQQFQPQIQQGPGVMSQQPPQGPFVTS